MALQFFDGFEGITQLKAGWTGTYQDMVGRYGGRAASPLASNSRLITPAATVIVGGAFRMSNNSATQNIIQLWGDNGATLHANLATNSMGQLQAKRSSTVLATSTQRIPADDNWYYIEVKSTIADTGGIFVVRVNGVEWINYTGDTKNAGTSTNFDTVQILRTSSSTSQSINYGTWDDFYIADGTGTSNNDFLGDMKVEAIRPNGNGATNAWTGTDGNSVDNYLLVAENPANTTDYVAASTVGSRELYEFGNLATLSGTVKAVQTNVYAQKSDAGTAAIRTVARLANGTESVSANSIALTDGWTMQSGPVLTTTPAGAAWTVADVNAAQFGYEVA